MTTCEIGFLTSKQKLPFACSKKITSYMKIDAAKKEA
jgi:hypothetical protein